MSSPDDQLTNASSTSLLLSTVSAPGTPVNDAETSGKRSIFNRKKKSVSTLTGSPSTNTLASITSSTHSAESGDSLEKPASEVGEANKKKKSVRDVFKRKPKTDSAAGTSGSIGSIEENREREDGEVDRDWADEGDGGNITDSPQRAHLFSGPSSNKSRSPSPGPPSRSSTSIGYMHSNNKENQYSADAQTSDVRPATSGGESSRPSEDRGRRTGRNSVGVTDGNRIPPLPPLATYPLQNISGDRRKTSLGVKNMPTVVTNDHPLAQTDSSLSTAPKTTVTPPTPTTDQVEQFPAKSPVGAVVKESSGGKRNRTNSLSNTPSKLSQSMTAPATPPLAKDGPEGLGSNGPTSPTASGFFQSMFSAAQNAASTISSNIPNLGNNAGNRPKHSSTDETEVEKPASRGEDSATVDSGEETLFEKEPAVNTLGKGELSLGSLGIVPSDDALQAGASISRAGSLTSHAAATSDSPVGQTSDAKNDEIGPVTSTQAGVETAGEVIPISYGGQDAQAPRKTPMAEDTTYNGLPQRDGLPGDGTPDAGSIIDVDDKDDWDAERKRPGSVQTKRHRGSSAASSGNLLQPVPKPTGFAVASNKRNRDFHQLFRSVPEDDYLIEDYGCALQKEILLQGRFYVSEGHICFNSNIFGWINTLVISFREVMRVEKKSTAMVFPNAIVIHTLHARYVFASFISRDSTYDLIVSIWKVAHPQLVSGVGETHVIQGASDVEDNGENSLDEDEDEDEYSDDEEEDLGESFTDAGDAPSYDDGSTISKGPSRKTSQALGVATAGSDGKVGPSGGTTVEFPGPQTHAPTSCGDEDQHLEKPLCDEIIAAPLGQVYSILFGPASYNFMSSFLQDEEKVLEIAISNNGEWSEGTPGVKKLRTYSYVRPLTGSIGPKQTRCLVTETLEVCELEDHVTVVMSIQTPDVPSGNVFLVKTRYCLMWAPDNCTRLVCNCAIEWSGKSWIKGPIEKGASDGQIAFNKSILIAIRREVAPKAPARVSKGKQKRRKDREAKGVAIGRAAGATAKGQEAQAAGFQSPADKESWGIFAPLKTYLGPIADIFGPLLSGNISVVIIFVLVILLVISQTRPRHVPQSPSRHWEDLWVREEEGLWEWLEDRAGLRDLPIEQQAVRMKGMENRIGARYAGQGVKNQQVDDAIGAMEERLSALKELHEKRKNEARRRVGHDAQASANDQPQELRAVGEQDGKSEL